MKFYTVDVKQVQEWVSLNHLRTLIGPSREVLDALRSSDAFTPAALSQIEQLPISTPLSLPFISLVHGEIGIETLSDSYPLLQSRWLTDKNLDARGRQIENEVNSANTQHSTSDRHYLLYLDSTFISLLPAILSNPHHHQRLLDTIQNVAPKYLAFIYNKDEVHWASCVIDIDKGCIWEADSLGWGRPADVFRNIKKFLRMVVPEVKFKLKTMTCPVQPPGSGDCGIIAMNTIQRFFDPSVTAWAVKRSDKMRLEWLVSRVHGHLQVTNKVMKHRYECFFKTIY